MNNHRMRRPSCIGLTLGPLLQVVYPALDTKVKNVTSAYTVEHQDEVGIRESFSNATFREQCHLARRQVCHDPCSVVSPSAAPYCAAWLLLAILGICKCPMQTGPLHSSLNMSCSSYHDCVSYFLQEYLFEHLASLLTSAVSQTGAERTATIRCVFTALGLWLAPCTGTWQLHCSRCDCGETGICRSRQASFHCSGNSSVHGCLVANCSAMLYLCSFNTPFMRQQGPHCVSSNLQAADLQG